MLPVQQATAMVQLIVGNLTPMDEVGAIPGNSVMDSMIISNLIAATRIIRKVARNLVQLSIRSVRQGSMQSGAMSVCRTALRDLMTQEQHARSPDTTAE